MVDLAGIAAQGLAGRRSGQAAQRRCVQGPIGGAVACGNNDDDDLDCATPEHGNARAPDAFALLAQATQAWQEITAQLKNMTLSLTDTFSFRLTPFLFGYFR